MLVSVILFLAFVMVVYHGKNLT